MVGKPAEEPREKVGAVRGWTDAQHGMAAARITRELHLAAGLLQGDEHLLALADRTPIVGLTLHDQRRRGGAVGKGRRRMRGECLARLVWLPAPLVLTPG